MDLYTKDPALTRAMAVALMRQAQGLLRAVEEDGAAKHLQMAVDVLLQAPAGTPEQATEAG